jgi:hypothetical protein
MRLLFVLIHQRGFFLNTGSVELSNHNDTNIQPLNTSNIMTYGIGNPGPSLG